MVEGRTTTHNTFLGAALEMEQEEELESLVQDEDEDGTTREGRRGGGWNNKSTYPFPHRWWKVIFVMIVAIILLFATDSIEIKDTNNGEFKDGTITARDDKNNNESSIITTTQDNNDNNSNNNNNNNHVTGGSADSDDDDDKDDDNNNNWYSLTNPTSIRTYKRRGQPLNDIEQQQMTNQWGEWKLIDPKADLRPKNDFYDSYPNRDIPKTKFPSNAWQLDKDYVEQFLTEGLQLVNRTMEAILSEYGHGKQQQEQQQKNDNGTFENRSTMFQFEFVDNPITGKKTPDYKQGGWTTRQSWNNLKKRILHSIMTQDSFIFAMGGHSAAAGHGNHFLQSYSLQVAWIMEPIFARLGVWHESRNFGNGGLGTAHNGIAAGSIYGPDVDLLMWDSGMTEREGHLIEMFARQALIGGIKVPAIWNIGMDLIGDLADRADVDVGGIGSGMSGIPKAENLQDLQNIAWAARYLSCDGDISNDYCKNNRYNATCWIERPDGFEPPMTQNDFPGGRAGWHPGNREHQLKGRIIAWLLLQAIQEVLTEWKMAENYDLPDDAWHVTAMYENTRTKLAALDPSTTHCKYFVNKNKTYFCTAPMQARTEFTPRAYAAVTSIRTIMPKQMLDNLPPVRKPIYLPPDILNPFLHPPPGEIDVLNIVENGIDFVPVTNPPYVTKFYQSESSITSVYQNPGKGIDPYSFTGSEGCDGTIHSWCNRGSDNECMLSGHNDARSGFFIDGLSGWLIFNVPKVRLGYVIVKFEAWHFPNENSVTEGWETINNETEAPGQHTLRHLQRWKRRDYPRNATFSNRTLTTSGYDSHYASESRNATPIRIFAKSARRCRRLKRKADPYCDEFRFEYSIDDRPINSLVLSEFEEKKMHIQRVVQTLTLLEEPDTWIEERDVQVAMRIINCGRSKVWSVNHVYWS